MSQNSRDLIDGLESKVNDIGVEIIEPKEIILIDPKDEYRIMGAKTIKLAPENTSYFNPFELGESKRESQQITLKDVINSDGELEPFDLVKEMGCTLEQYAMAKEMIRLCKENGFNTKQLI
jgi:hypothetical protein